MAENDLGDLAKTLIYSNFDRMRVEKYRYIVRTLALMKVKERNYLFVFRVLSRHLDTYAKTLDTYAKTEQRWRSKQDDLSNQEYLCHTGYWKKLRKSGCSFWTSDGTYSLRTLFQVLQ